ncbi:transmembrane protein 230 [Iris pallida]|uniref:Transmembrane protein 230 n=1 Tax=Iris pallida TaxID=29817 RepID=A0AAX6DW98_IRIPA|nr:transmembrane protein 230 [Iris pallida]
MFAILHLLDKKGTMMYQKRTFDLPTIPRHLTEFHGGRLPLHFFFSHWDHFYCFSHSSSSRAIWEVISPKHTACLSLAFLPSCLDFTRLGLHITHGEVPQDIGLPQYLLTELLRLYM